MNIYIVLNIIVLLHSCQRMSSDNHSKDTIKENKKQVIPLLGLMKQYNDTLNFLQAFKSLSLSAKNKRVIEFKNCNSKIF